LFFTSPKNAFGGKTFQLFFNYSKVYLHDPRCSHSLADNVILSLFVDKAGTLWIGCDCGLNLMDRNNGTFTRFLHDPQSVNSLTDNRVIDIFQDRNGYLWISTFMGLNRMDPKTNTITRYLDKATRTNAAVGNLPVLNPVLIASR
jgi:ligand-binding sensor domain-containing protein